MANKTQAYDHPAYTAVHPVVAGEAGGGATTLYSKFAAFTAMKLKSAQLVCTLAGTVSTHLFSLVKITAAGTATSTIVTSTFGTSAASISTNVSGSDTALAQGDLLCVVSGADATGKAAVTYELVISPGSNLTV